MPTEEHNGPTLPESPIDALSRPIVRFMHVESASGVVLLLSAVVALLLANSSFGDAYTSIWKTPFGFRIGSFEMVHSLKHWINDGLMAIFFFVVGLEVKRELMLGELRELRRAALPVIAALGGMVVPAAIYLAMQWEKPASSGWGVAMATDIAFVVGCMALLGSRLPHGFRVMILSLAIADDVGAILVIAIGYTDSLNLSALALGFAGLALVGVLIRVGVRSLLIYGAVAMAIWLAFHESGVHATIAGVLLGLLVPARTEVSESLFSTVLNRAAEVFHGGGWESTSGRTGKIKLMQRFTKETIPPVEYLEGVLHPWVSFLIMPVFALANAGVRFELADLTNPVALSVAAGLVLGKPIGICLFSLIAVKGSLAELPKGVSWMMMIGGGLLAGIGFTMALFIAGLALPSELLDVAKVGILGASLVAGLAGMVTLFLFTKGNAPRRA